MKLHDKRRKVLCLMLVFTMITGLLFGPMKVFPAKAEESGTVPEDSSAVTVTQQTIWYWHKGLPPADGNQYRVLLVWKDKYFLNCDADFCDSMITAALGNTMSASAYTNTNGQHNGSYTKAVWQSPRGWYWVETTYSGENNSVALLDFDYNVLKETGTAVSFNMPDTMPVMQHYKPFETLNDHEIENGLEPAERVLIGMTPTKSLIDGTRVSNGYMGIRFNTDEINWLCGLKWMDYHKWKENAGGIAGAFGGKITMQARKYFWYLVPCHSKSFSQLVNNGVYDFKNISPDREDDLVHENLDLATWYATEHAPGRYAFSTRGFITSAPGSVIDSNYDDYKYLAILASKEANMYLGYNTALGSSLATYGNRNMVYRYSKTHYPPDLQYNFNWSSGYSDDVNRYFFDVYYAEPNLMYYLNSDIVVENGQVQNLDGPLVIEEGTVITVKDGGVLSLTDWIVNNGQILIEPGGTMIVQSVQTENWTRNSAVVPSVKDKGTAAGRVSCDGVVIVMPGCTLAGGGIYGLEFGEGAQCVNYGNLISENWNVYTDHTIENRSADCRVKIGYSIIDSGFSLMEVPLDQAGSSLGIWQDGGMANMANDYLYGSATVNRNSRCNYVVMPNRRGSVTANGPAAH